MAGHSKWANIRLRKGAQDAKRGKAFTKAAKEIIIAAKAGGDPAGNARLRSAIAAAKAVNLPKDKIEAAIRKGTGQDAGGELFEITYEGYGAGGVAIIVETATDNKNRTVAEVRHAFTKYGGAMGESGSVAFQFDRMGVITLEKEKYADEETVMNMALEAGAEDVQDEGDVWEVRTAMGDFNTVREALEAEIDEYIRQHGSAQGDTPDEEFNKTYNSNNDSDEDFSQYEVTSDDDFSQYEVK